MLYEAFLSEWITELRENYWHLADRWNVLAEMPPAEVAAYHGMVIDDLVKTGKDALEKFTENVHVDIFPGIDIYDLWQCNEAARESLVLRVAAVAGNHFVGEIALSWFDKMQADDDEETPTAEGFLDKIMGDGTLGPKLGILGKAVMDRLTPELLGIPEDWKDQLAKDPTVLVQDLMARREELMARVQGIVTTTLNELMQNGTLNREELMKDLQKLREKLGNIIPDLMKQSMNITPSDRSFADPRRQKVLERLRRKRDQQKGR